MTEHAQVRNPTAAVGQPRLGSALVLVLCLFPTLAHLPAAAAQEITPAQRAELERRAAELTRQAVQLHAQGQYPASFALLEQAQEMRKRLYPPDQYPQGHAELARNLNDLALLSQAQAKYDQARGYYEQALAMWERLYPADKFPDGHPDLAGGLHNLAVHLQNQRELAGARAHFDRALAMFRRLYPKEKYPNGHPLLATCLSNVGDFASRAGDSARALAYLTQAVEMHERLLAAGQHPGGNSDLADSLLGLGTVLTASGEYARARPCLERSLALSRQVFPEEKFPRGHPAIAGSLRRLGNLLAIQGEHAQARAHQEQALAIYEAFYPKGHPNLAATLIDLGDICQALKDSSRAQEYYLRALAMAEQLFPEARHPRGHAVRQVALEKLGTLLRQRGQYEQGRPYLEQALAMQRRLYPSEEYPHGHPAVANTLTNLGLLLHFLGDYAAARSCYDEALAVRRRLHPEDQGRPAHPFVLLGLHNLAALLASQGEYAAALEHQERALAIYRESAEAFTAAASEAEALNFAARMPQVANLLLSVSRHVPDADGRAYAQLWHSKAVVARVLERRHQAVVRAAGPGADPARRQQVEQLGQDLQAARRELSRLLATTARDPKAYRQKVSDLSAAKEQLERQLAELVPEFGREQALQRSASADLLERLPARTVFLDLIRYVYTEQDPKRPGRAGSRATPSYAAFVLRPGEPVRRVELGDAAPIDDAVAAWRRDLAARQPGAAADTLRRLVWEPLTRHVPADTATVLVAPDGALTRLPWAALPGAKKGTVLLEEYALAVVPHGPFVLGRLRAEPRADKNPGLLLAVGGVQYDQAARPAGELVASRSAEHGGKPLSWKFLPGTAQELDAVVRLAGERPVRALRGAEAGTAQLLAELPRARWVHLATHGFFADAKLRSVLQLDEEVFRGGLTSERMTAGTRNPLVLSGLVLAGANLPPPKETAELLRHDGGILTAEAVTGLPLHGLELAVLSACETGLGEVAGGEGVFGLQRAFHLAGARSVVASLWKVDDQATRALMAEFYTNLWDKKLPKLEALRQAQLALLKRYDQARGQLRGPDEVPLPAKSAAGGAPAGGAPFYWAAFVLSGDWR